jgi:hypothetical protein
MITDHLLIFWRATEQKLIGDPHVMLGHPIGIRIISDLIQRQTSRYLVSQPEILGGSLKHLQTTGASAGWPEIRDAAIAQRNAAAPIEGLMNSAEPLNPGSKPVRRIRAIHCRPSMLREMALALAMFRIRTL